MDQKNYEPASPAEPAWDIQFTRLVQSVGPQIAGCTADIMRWFKAIGLDSDAQALQTPRGISHFVAISGQRGLICIVDITLIDGMALGRGACAWLDTRLLDASGDVVATNLGKCISGHTVDAKSASKLLSMQNMGQVTTTVFVAALGLFQCRPSAVI